MINNSMYNKNIKLCMVHPLGYIYFCDKTHPLADDSGIVYYHRHLVSVHIGRWLTSKEHVHHIDGDKLNNSIDNLEVLSSSEHAHMHKGYRRKSICVFCGKEYLQWEESQKYCSETCRTLCSRKFEVTAEELRRLVWSMPTIKVAKLFSVSDKAIEKRCKILGVEKPSRGYWNKVYADKLNKEDLYGE